MYLGRSVNGEAIQAEVWGGTAIILTGLLVYEYGPWVTRRTRSGRGAD